LPGDIHKILKDNWGYDSFRPFQQEIIESVMEGNDTLALLPTGGGKSITFQVPALAHDGLCLVISPLIALMKDQVDNLRAKGIAAMAIYSGMSFYEIQKALELAVAGKLKLLYCSPERLETEIFLDKVPMLKLNLIAVDEAHCISEWGYDFRPSYLKISALREYFPETPLLALTATATEDVKKDIQEKLHFNKPNVFQNSFERKNLIYAVLNDESKKNRLITLLKKIKGSGIVYARTRRSTKEVAELLNHHQISADYYHAGLDNKDRAEKQKKWKTGQIRIMVATNAFGMGIDKADVRSVIHFDLPESMEAYYQEAGRAGRDLQKSYAISIVNNNDITILEERITKAIPSRKDISHAYQCLANYLQIAEGAGLQQTYNFNMNLFCKTYNLNAANVYDCFKTLEREGFIELIDDVFLPSRLLIKANYQDLYEYQLSETKMEPLIKTLLRSYEGLFDYYVKISENDIARRLNISKEMVINQLEYLSKTGILDYQASNEKSHIFFPVERVSTSELFIDQKALEKRKSVIEKKIRSILNYAFNAQGCRSRVMLAYFGEKAPVRCGHCDYCLKIHNTDINDEEYLEISNIVQNLLIKESMQIDRVIESVKTYRKEHIVKIIRWMIDDKIISISKDDLLSVKK
jgi:ATP-dependent DNA helicase RecQ